MSGRALVGVLAGVAVLGGAPGCGDSSSDAEELSVATVSYRTSGQVVALPTPSSHLQIRHELIPDFRETLDQDPPKGMPAMTMPFSLGVGVSLDGLEPGDHVELMFDVDYRELDGAIAGYRLSAIEEVEPRGGETSAAEMPEVIELPPLTIEEQAALDEHLELFASEAEAFFDQHQSSPESMAALGEAAALDPWGQAYQITVVDDESVVIVSAGPDRRFDTQDDIAELIQIDHGQDARD